MWIELHDTLPDNPKLIKLAAITQLPETQVIGMLACLWTWALTNREDGTLSELDWRAVERAARWAGEPKAFFDALVTARFIDATTDGATLHDWLDYTGKLAERRAKDRARKAAGKAPEMTRSSAGIPQEFQRNSDGIPEGVHRNSTGTPYATVPNRTIPIDDDDERAHMRKDTDKSRAKTAQQVCRHFELAFGYEVPACIEEEIDGHLTDGLDVGLLFEAIDQAVKHGARNWAYASSVLGNCADQGVKTLSAYRAAQGVRKAENTAARARAAPTTGSRGSGDFAEVEYANQRTYSKEDFAKLTASVDNL